MGPIVFVAAVVGLFTYVAFPFILPVSVGAVFAVLLYPAQARLERLKVPRAIASLLLTLGLTVLFLLPTVLLVVMGARTAFQQLRVFYSGADAGVMQLGGEQLFQVILDSRWVQSLVRWLGPWLSITPEELVYALQDVAGKIGIRAADVFGSFVTHLPSVFVTLAVVVLSVFFFLFDGSRFLLFLRENSFLKKKQTDRIIETFGNMCRSVLLATVVSGFAQALIFSLACVISGVASVPMIGLLAFLTSFIPFVGSAPVTFSVAAFQAMNGNSGVALALGIVALFVTVIDNFIRPLVLKGAGNLHPLLAFVAAFGGMATLGISGILLGPILAGIFVVTVQMMLQKDPSA